MSQSIIKNMEKGFQNELAKADRTIISLKTENLELFKELEQESKKNRILERALNLK